MKISILVSCYNEEKTISKSLDSCINQTRPADEIVVVNDGSKDRTLAILEDYKEKYNDLIVVVNILVNGGGKSYAQEKGLQYVTGDVFITADADTLLDPEFVENIEREFKDPKIMAVAGYVKSLKGNMLTAFRELEYFYSQELHKYAQSYMDSIYIIPGCASAFRKKLFNVLIKFSHDTITEDLDFTYQFHKLGVKIKFCREAIVYTQDPNTFSSYLNQIRRWYGGGWQNLIKNAKDIRKKALMFEIFLMYVETTIFGLLLLITPFFNLYYFFYLLLTAFLFAFAMSIYAAFKRQRIDLVLASPMYVVMLVFNSYVFMEQMIKHVILKRKTVGWFKPERRAIA